MTGPPRDPAASRTALPSRIAPPPFARVGCDVVAVRRVSRLARTYAPAFLHDVFSTVELEGDAVDLARAFAVKEATLKALGTGQAAGVRLSDVEVELWVDGSASARLSGVLEPVAAAYESAAITFVDGGCASAVVVLSRREGERCATS